jgi:L-alanine-DL-glutamate epimerase-like enolase superfamily enzyme
MSNQLVESVISERRRGGPSTRIDGFELNRLKMPAGRLIGDNNCAYDSFELTVVRLKTASGLVGWGYGELASHGRFDKAAWWIEPAASFQETVACFKADWWPLLQGRDPFETRLARRNHVTTLRPLDCAIRIALWDLMAKQVELPLYRMLGGFSDRIKCYGSILDFPLSEDEAVSLAKHFVQTGFKLIKIKVGSPSVERDLQRLSAIRAAVGDHIELTADANNAWDARTTELRIGEFTKAGLRLGYIEDPIPYDRVDQYAALAGRLDIDVVGHDYLSTLGEMRALLGTGALNRVRCGADIDLILDIAELARERDLPLIFGNSIFEMNVHAACALPNVDRLEFSGLAWNELVDQPVRFEDGFAYPPQAPGHGLELKEDALQ